MIASSLFLVIVVIVTTGAAAFTNTPLRHPYCIRPSSSSNIVVHSTTADDGQTPEAAAPSAPAAPTTTAPVSPTRPPPPVNAADVSKQKLYGTELEYPGTYVRCGRCQTSFALAPEDLGTRGKGCRIECSVCSHSWYQSRDRIFTIHNGYEFIPLPSHDLTRISNNLKNGNDPNFMGAYKLYVGNLDFRTTEDELRDYFAQEGDVGDVNLVMDQQTGRSRGFAFVTMMTKEEGEKAMETLDGSELNGRNINVKPPN